MPDQPLTKDEKERLLKSMEASLRTVAEPDDNRPKALYFYRRADLRKTVTRQVENEAGEMVWETVTTDGYGKVVE